MFWWLAACAPEAMEEAEIPPTPSLELETSPSPIDHPGRFYADIAYDHFERTAMDLHLPEGEGPFPVSFFLPGGAFRWGDKENAWLNFPDDARALLDRGIAVGSIEYRLLDDPEDTGVSKPLGDVRRGVQFARLHADELAIDPERLGLHGFSAGASIALWLGVADDQADPTSEDPVDRQSSRVATIGAMEVQATLDIVRWEEIFSSYGLSLETAEILGLEQGLLDMYAAPDLEAVRRDPVFVAYRAEVDMLDLLDSDDPPMWIRQAEQGEVPPITLGRLFHHPYHARDLDLEARAAGIEVVTDIPALGVSHDGYLLTDFIADRL